MVNGMNEKILLDRKLWSEALPLDREEVALHLMETKLKGAFDYLGIQTFSCGGVTNHIAIFQHQATKMTFHLIPGGSFNFGAGANIDTISKLYSSDLSEDGGDVEFKVSPFLISTYMITEFAWQRFDGNKLYEYHGDAHAVDAIERDAAQVWAEKIGARLPSEAEWEYACKAGTSSIFYWGQEPDIENAWISENTVFDDDHKPRREADQKAPNAFGLLGMIGNLAEWVIDDAYDIGSEAWYDVVMSSPGEPYYNKDNPSCDGILRGGWDSYGWKFNRSTSRIACGSADTGCSARIVFGNLLQGKMISVTNAEPKKPADVGAISTNAAHVILTEIGDRKVQVIKAIASITGLNVSGAKALLKAVPYAAIQEHIPLDEALRVKEALEAVGASVVIEEERVRKAKAKKTQKLVDAARKKKLKSKTFSPGNTPKLIPYRIGAHHFANFLDSSAGEEKEEYIKNHYIDYFKMYTTGIDSDLGLKSGTAQAMWADYIRGRTHDGLSHVYWSFFNMLGQSFFGTQIEEKLKPSDILALTKLGGSFRNSPIADSPPPSYCQGVEGLTVFSIYNAYFKTARLSAKDILSAEGFEIFSGWIDEAIEHEEDLVLFRVSK